MKCNIELYQYASETCFSYVVRVACFEHLAVAYVKAEKVDRKIIQRLRKSLSSGCHERRFILGTEYCAKRLQRLKEEMKRVAA
ncbi:hypothetical protein [Candidatus Manganitrophus noduliformans]|uniref:Uncharacterized protein n=1 Tax=Candidatus Manganitrophus noduliformans TaxID=2606439 RepID=A0A7X6I9Z6_9BACT|nr:hypothetical protein [Candidatus Manganitrophus noduliformans]NKE69880.1 hypothetical protein [Candidatus Manganitrophus noduliformans]